MKALEDDTLGIAGVCLHSAVRMTSKITNSLLILTVGGLMVVGSAGVQTATTTSGAGPGVVDPGHPRVNEVNRRQANQQKRIANGIKQRIFGSEENCQSVAPLWTSASAETPA